MIPKPWISFMDRLLQATWDNEIKWQEGGEDSYFAIQKNAELHLRYLTDDEAEERVYQFRILRSGNDAFFSSFHYESDFHLMRNLYSAASVNAAGGADIVNGLFD
jgi:hypothetical protein